MKKFISLLLCLMMLTGLTTAVTAATVDNAALGDDEVALYFYLSVDDTESTFGVEYPKGDIPQRPADPDIEGMTFIDWYTDKGLLNRFDFRRPMYEDVHLYARFAPTADVIGVNEFDSPSAEEPTYGYLLVKGDYAEYPYDPEIADDELFLGWYSDRALTKQFDFTQPVYDYLYLFPRVVKEDDVCWGDLYFDADADYPIASFAVVKGEPCPVPAEPGKDDYEFKGWYTDRALTKPMDFTKPCTADFELFPKWEQVCRHENVMDYLIEELPATATTDGLQSHFECPHCGKWFYPTFTALIEVEDHDELIIDAYGPYLLGDADGSGEVGSIDITLIQRRLAAITTVGPFCRGAADVDGDKELSIIDATFISRSVARMTVPYEINTLVYPAG